MAKAKARTRIIGRKVLSMEEQYPVMHEITADEIRSKEQLIRNQINKDIAEERAEHAHRKKEPWEKKYRDRPLPASRRLTTDDIRNILISVPLSAVAAYVAYRTGKKIQYAFAKRSVKRVKHDLTEDAKRQLVRSIDSIEEALTGRSKILWGRRKRKDPYKSWTPIGSEGEHY